MKVEIDTNGYEVVEIRDLNDSIISVVSGDGKIEMNFGVQDVVVMNQDMVQELITYLTNWLATESLEIEILRGKDASEVSNDES